MKSSMIRLATLMAAVVLAGCAAIVKVEGESTVGDRLVVRVPDAWNKVSAPGSQQPFEVWTQDGVTVDQIRIWVAVASGKALVAPPPRAAAGQKEARIPTFAATMQPDQIVNLFEQVYAVDGSIVTLTKVEPADFAGQRGVRFEFDFVRKGDDVHLKGLGWAAVSKGELFAVSFTAPRLSFFARLAPRVEAIAASARIKG